MSWRWNGVLTLGIQGVQVAPCGQVQSPDGRASSGCRSSWRPLPAAQHSAVARVEDRWRSAGSVGRTRRGRSSVPRPVPAARDAASRAFAARRSLARPGHLRQRPGAAASVSSRDPSGASFSASRVDLSQDRLKVRTLGAARPDHQDRPATQSGQSLAWHPAAHSPIATGVMASAVNARTASASTNSGRFQRAATAVRDLRRRSRRRRHGTCPRRTAPVRRTEHESGP